MYNYPRGFVVVSNGRSNGRSFADGIDEGTIRINGTDENGNPFQRIVKVKEGQIFDNTFKREKKTLHRVVYGQFETTKTAEGRSIVHFNPKTGTGKHGLSRTYEELFGHPGVCHSWYKRGRLVRQKFFYDNKVLAYDWNAFTLFCTVKDYDGSVLFEIKGALDSRCCAYRGGHTVLASSMENWFLERKPFEVKKGGKVIYKGQRENRQKVGLWVENGQEVYYEAGVAIPKKLYETPPEKLNPLEVLKIQNAQVRMALAHKIGPDRIAKAGKTIHRDGDMRLYKIGGYDVSILRVKCPSTNQFFFLRVPKDSKECEQARQWTFGVGDGISQPIKFEKEV